MINIPESILDVESRGLYVLGNTAIAKKEYDRADSLFTLSLRILPHPDTYYNRAVCRRRMNDFSGYCVDLASAANMSNPGSAIAANAMERNFFMLLRLHKELICRQLSDNCRFCMLEVLLSSSERKKFS